MCVTNLITIYYILFFACSECDKDTYIFNPKIKWKHHFVVYLVGIFKLLFFMKDLLHFFPVISY